MIDFDLDDSEFDPEAEEAVLEDLLEDVLEDVEEEEIEIGEHESLEVLLDKEYQVDEYYRSYGAGWDDV